MITLAGSIVAVDFRLAMGAVARPLDPTGVRSAIHAIGVVVRKTHRVPQFMTRKHPLGTFADG